jgi:hypothetical protein
MPHDHIRLMICQGTNVVGVFLVKQCYNENCHPTIKWEIFCKPEIIHIVREILYFTLNCSEVLPK